MSGGRELIEFRAYRHAAEIGQVAPNERCLIGASPRLLSQLDVLLTLRLQLIRSLPIACTRRHISAPSARLSAGCMHSS